MSLLLDDLAQWLLTQNIVGGSTGWTVTEGFLPPSDPKKPSQQFIALFETAGEPPDIIRDPTIDEQPVLTVGLQVRGRGAINLANSGAYNALRQKMQDVYNGLHQNEPPPPVSGDGNKYVFIYAKTSGPLPMGRDEQQRDEMSWNFRVRMIERPGYAIPTPPSAQVPKIQAWGFVTLVNGSATILTPYAQPGVKMQFSPQDLDTVGEIRPDPSSIVPGVSIDIYSTGAFDFGVILWTVVQ